MVSRELDYNRIVINDSNLQKYLKANNISYSEARKLYNSISKNQAIPLTDSGLSTDRFSFLIILLEKVLRNTEPKRYFRKKIKILEQNIYEIKQLGLDPIIQVGNLITKELKTFELGFKDWNNKFDNFTIIFQNWNKGFKSFEENFTKLENFINIFSDYWEKNITRIETNLQKIELNITQWDEKFIYINNKIDKIEQYLQYINNKDINPNTPLTSSK